MGGGGGGEMNGIPDTQLAQVCEVIGYHLLKSDKSFPVYCVVSVVVEFGSQQYLSRVTRESTRKTP